MTRAVWKYVSVPVSMWLLILGYMGWQLLSEVEYSDWNEAVVLQKERQIELLQNQYNWLQKQLAEIEGINYRFEIEAGELRNTNLELQRKLISQKASADVFESPTSPAKGKRDSKPERKLADLHGLTPPSKEFLTTRRRAEKNLKELWYFVSSEISQVNKIASENVTVKTKLRQMMGTVEDMHHTLSIDFEKMKTIDGQREWLVKEHKFLSDLVQRRLHGLQHPKDCNAAKKLVCELNKGCGYGCQVHHLMYCFIVAYGLERTLIVDSSGWRYSSKGWNGIFKPVSETCTTYQGSLQPTDVFSGILSKTQQNVLLLPYVERPFSQPKYMPLAVPKDLAAKIEQIHSHPFVWWIGQFAKYLFRYAPEVQEEIDKKRALLGFKKPVVGVQVRRTDKLYSEAAFHSLEEYMYWVDLYYNKLERIQPVEKRRVYLATDDGDLLPKAKAKYTNYEFISDQGISKSAGPSSRYSDSSLHGVVFDIQMLSECDYLVCTFSSGICRVAYEIMQASQPDAAKKFQSLDDLYYFTGQSGNVVRAVYPHKAQNRSQIDLAVGDKIRIAGNHWDGYSKGVNRRHRGDGLFPSYKVEDIMEVADFPTYDGV